LINPSVARIARIASFVLVLAAVSAPAALAGKGGKPGGDATGGGTIELVLLNSTDGVPHHGQQVTFNVSTSAARPFVSLNCYQGGVWVYSASAGFFPDYPWSKNFTLSASSWPSGAADCTARLYTTKDGTRTTTLATLTFAVYA
jgi:hypothetical protein